MLGTYPFAYIPLTPVLQCVVKILCFGTNFFFLRWLCQVFCPAGSGSPSQVGGGYYGIGPSGAFVDRLACPTGSYCEGGVIKPCAAGRYGDRTGNSNSLCDAMCPAGSYCPGTLVCHVLGCVVIGSCHCPREL
jgi:hypothetical protein